MITDTLTSEYKQFLEEWAANLEVSIEVLTARIVTSTCEGFLYVEGIPDRYPVEPGI
jgi:hypothetical protein